MECFTVLVIAGLGVGVAIDGLHLPLGNLECHLFILFLLKIHLLFALLLMGRAPTWHSFYCFLRNSSTIFLISWQSLMLWRVELCTGHWSPLSSLPDA
jgi:hypothetical protein